MEQNIALEQYRCTGVCWNFATNGRTGKYRGWGRMEFLSKQKSYLPALLFTL